jgi:hypothetical protein
MAESILALRVEWAKTRARKDRWAEEVSILREEMRRVLVFLEHNALQWENRATARQDDSPELAEGLQAYAHRQAGILRSRANLFAVLWSKVLLRDVTQDPSHATDSPVVPDWLDPDDASSDADEEDII